MKVLNEQEIDMVSGGFFLFDFIGSLFQRVSDAITGGVSMGSMGATLGGKYGGHSGFIFGPIGAGVGSVLFGGLGTLFGAVNAFFNGAKSTVELSNSLGERTGKY